MSDAVGQKATVSQKFSLDPSRLEFILKDKHTSLLSLTISLGLALCASGLVLLLWMAGVLASLESAFLLSIASETNPAAAPQMWLGALMILAAGLSAGFAIERGGAKRILPFLLGGLLVLAGASLFISRFKHIDIAFAPMALAALSSAFAVQLRRLWMIDKMLTRSLARAASQTSKVEGGSSHARLMSGLKLLETVLPVHIYSVDGRSVVGVRAVVDCADFGGAR